MIEHCRNHSSLARLGAAGCAIIVAVAGATLTMPLPAAAQPAVQEPAQDGTTVLHLGETAERSLPRDRLRAQLRAEATGSSAKQVQAEINKRMAAALERARAVSGVKLETGSYSVYEERQQNGASRWHGSQTLSLSGGDFAQVLALTGDLQNDGLAMSGLAFELAPETARAAQDELTAEALKRLRARAERVAGDLQLSLMRFRDVKVGNVANERPPMPLAMKAMSAPVAEAGEAVLQVAVEADAVLVPADPHAP